MGGLLAAIPFTWVLNTGRLDFAQRSELGDFYDAQAHSLLGFHWDVPAELLAFEGFVIEERTYMYFGPTPALLRLPIVAFTDQLDGRLTQLSMLLALGVTLGSTSRLSWRIRRAARGDEPVGLGETWAVGGFTFLLGAGSSLVFLASDTIVFHEAILWGVALSMAAYDALVAHLEGGSRWALVRLAVLSSLAILTRGSVGGGPVVATGLVLAVLMVGSLRGGRRNLRSRRRDLAALVLACLLPVVLYAVVNQAKFGTLFSIPWTEQTATKLFPERAQFLDENDGSFFKAKFVPTAVVNDLRPDALSLVRQLPWIDFPGPPDIVGDVRFDTVDRSSSITATMPWLAVLATAGAVLLVRRRSVASRAVAALTWAPLGGAVAGALAVASVGFIAHRYISDALPLFLLGGMAGMHLLSGASPRWQRAAATVFVLTGFAALWINLALALVHQRLAGSTDEATRAEIIAWQLDADDLLPGDQAPRLRTGLPGAVLPRNAREDVLFAVGDCDGLYQWDGRRWRPVERREGVGRFVLDVRRQEGRQPLLVSRSGATALSLEPQPDGKAAFVLKVDGRSAKVGEMLALEPGRHYRVVAVLDRRLNTADVFLDGEKQLAFAGYAAPDDELGPPLGASDSVRARSQSAPVCRQLLGTRS